MDDLLRDLAATERKLRELAEQPHGPGAPACWPAWRMLLAKTRAPGDFEAWWAAHGRSCATCRAAHERLARETEPPTTADLPLAAEPTAAYNTQAGASLRQFLAALPARVADAHERETLNACLRVLHGEGRLSPSDMARLAKLDWLDADLRDTFAAGAEGR